MAYPQGQPVAPMLSQNRDLRRYARECLRGNWAIMVAAFVLIGIITVAIMIPYYAETMMRTFQSISLGTFTNDPLASFTPLYFLTMLAAYLITPAFAVGSAMLCLRLIRTRKAEITDIFQGFRIFLKAFGAMVMVAIFTFLWSLLLVIPGIIAAYRYSQVFYILADHPEMSVFDAIRLSKVMMTGAKFKLFCMQLSFIGWGLLSLLTLYIGLLWLYPYISVSLSAFYEDVNRRHFAMTQPVRPAYDAPTP